MPDEASESTEVPQSGHQQVVGKRISESALQVAQTAGIVMGGAGGLVGGIATAIGSQKAAERAMLPRRAVQPHNRRDLRQATSSSRWATTPTHLHWGRRDAVRP